MIGREQRPVGRPFGSSDASMFPLVAGEIGDSSAPDIGDDHESSQSPRRRITQKQLNQVGASLSQADFELLKLVWRFRLMSGEQIQRLNYGRSESQARAARRQLLRLSKVDVLERLDRRVGGVRSGSSGYIYAVGLLGQKLLDRDRRARRHKEVGWPFLRHTLAISESYVQLHERYDGTAGFALSAFDPEPHAWREQTSAFGEQMHLRPDAFAVLDDETAGRRQYWFIEVDLGTESSTVLKKKMRQYVSWYETGFEQDALGAFPRVHWHASNEQRRQQLQQLAEETPGPSGLHSTSLLLDALAQTREPP